MKTIALLLALCLTQFMPAPVDSIVGAWEHRDQGTIQSRIYTSAFFSVAIYNIEGKQFIGTYGGKYTISGEKITELIEFDTRNPERVGTEVSGTFTVYKDKFTLSTSAGANFSRLDNGGPGQLAGAWLITGRVNDKGETRRSTPGARRTMKILSGTKFQWIAYNVDTREFFGTGGGSYTSVDGKYTENIEFFSRDNSRVGASLGFDFSIQDGDWNHKGLSSKGEPINEIWTKREKVGM